MSFTDGEDRVGVSFNPSDDKVVDKLKKDGAGLIDKINQIQPKSAKEVLSIEYDTQTEELSDFHKNKYNRYCNQVARCKSLAATHIENAIMWAVKAQTKHFVAKDELTHK